MNDPTPTIERNPFHRAASLSELLLWHDVDFVRCAYVSVLGRQPDAEGETRYTRRLRAGRSKMEILQHLRRSPEAKDHDPGISGFDRALKLAAWSRRRVLGLPLRLFAAHDSDGPADRRNRVLLNVLERNNDQIMAIADQLHSLRTEELQFKESSERFRPDVPSADEADDAMLRSLTAHERALYQRLNTER